ncbi:golgin subfamily A member 5-like [Diabrotica virgifera virgifera]|uniref:Telomeric repeat-binding factor 2-interacting protein 1 n=1 Tax=Diabrotica virgifera virgifera TaxID=50390 RepID=A0ABM5JUS9_DIAVI|nr:golgin subfamily A member 5-like [Diabrotica virgifera virgifera]
MVDCGYKRGYTINEDNLILNWIIRFKGYYHLRGTILWRDMEAGRIFLEDRTWQSLKNRFIKTLEERKIYTIKEHIKDKVKELEDNKAEFASTLAARESQIQEVSTTLTNKAQEIENLKKEIGALVEKYELSNKEVVASHTQEITARDEKIRHLESEILQKDQNIKFHVDASNEHQENLNRKDLDLIKIRSELEESQKTSSVMIASLKNQIEGLQNDNKQQQSRNNELQTELQNREQLNVTINTEIGKAAENLAVLVEQVKQKDDLIESLRSDVTSREIELENVLATNLNALSEKNEAERRIRAEKERLCMTIGLKNEELEELPKRLTDM